MRCHPPTIAAWPLVALLLAPSAAAVQLPTEPPRLSPLASVSQVVGVSRVEITYSRPAVAGRDIWGELVPWGEVWRTGANEATRIEISDDAQVDGQPLAAGSYALFTIPEPDAWTVIFHREAEQWGAFAYDRQGDALRIQVRPRTGEFQERLLIHFPTVGADSTTVALRWGEVLVPFKVTFDLPRIAARRAREFVAQATPADGRAVWNWANYLYQNDFDTEEALGWAADLTAGAPMYWTHALHARLLARHGRLDEAIAAAESALATVTQESDQPGVEADAAALAEELAGWRSDPGPS